MDEQLLQDLRRAYDGMAPERDQLEVAPWKREERERFLALLEREGSRTLLEIGAGTGAHALFFQEQGLQVVCVDLSPQNVALCRAKGLVARTMDFLGLDFPAGSFDAVYAMNCLIHVPREDLPAVLRTVRDVLKPGGLFYLGQYGGIEQAGVWEGDHYEPKRFFSFLTDEQLQALSAACFEMVSFRRVRLEDEAGFHFQSLILRRSAEGVGPENG
jgi:SAM-dependent methyltransferase